MIEISDEMAGEIIEALTQLDESHECDDMIRTVEAKLAASVAERKNAELYPEC